WVPSNVESALFGTRITDRFFSINVGGDVAFLSGSIKHMIESGWIDRGFVDQHTSGFEELARSLDAMEWETLEAQAGAGRGEMLAFARMVGEANAADFVCSVGVTQL